jgi:hypothetical protein
MKHFLIAAALAAIPAPAFAADVGVSISVGQPGFYGQIDVGDVPRPVLIYPEPVIIQPAPVGVMLRPIYMRVPPGHARNWGRYCHQYDACGRRVFFVQDRWYNDVYVPHYQREHGGGGPHRGGGPYGGGHKGGKGKGHRGD